MPSALWSSSPAHGRLPQVVDVRSRRFLSVDRESSDVAVDDAERLARVRVKGEVGTARGELEAEAKPSRENLSRSSSRETW